ncbi:MAG TPA: hypothetical protein VFD04_13115 [Actinomycetes bacterium]|nr:hypothetical protein [Actinomycetes bacterium]
MTAPPMRVVIAEDSAVLREGLVALLADRGWRVCAAVADAAALRALGWTPRVATRDGLGALARQETDVSNQ